MANSNQCARLTHEGALNLIQAAASAAKDLGISECVVVGDNGGNVLASLRMDGAKYLSMHSAQAKAVSAASSGRPTRGMNAEIAS